MNSPNPVSAPAAAPWYQSNVIRGILVALFSWLLLFLKTKYKIDFVPFGVDANSLADAALLAIASGASAYAVRARVTGAMPTLTANKSQAAAINAVSPPIPTQATVRASTPPEDTQ